MSNGLFVTYKNRVLGSGASSLADWDTDTIKGTFCGSGYTVNLTTHDFYNDVTSGARVANATLSTLSITGGAVKISGSVTFTPTATSTITQLVIYKDTGTESTSPLLAYFDTFTAGMPLAVTNTVPFVVNFDATGIVIL